jgi:hypothetical protein
MAITTNVFTIVLGAIVVLEKEKKFLHRSQDGNSVVIRKKPPVTDAALKQGIQFNLWSIMLMVLLTIVILET